MWTDEYENDDFEDDGPQEEDWATEDHVNFYEYGGRRRHMLTLQVQERPGSRHKRDAEPGELSDSAMWRQIVAEMRRQRFFPSVWFVSDHGNAHLMERPKRRRKRH